MNLITNRLLHTIAQASTELPGLNFTDVRTALLAYRDYFRALLDQQEPAAFDLRPRADALLDHLEIVLDEYSTTQQPAPDNQTYHQAFKLALRDLNRYNTKRRTYLPDLPARLEEQPLPHTTPAAIQEPVVEGTPVNEPPATEADARPDPAPPAAASKPAPAKKTDKKAIGLKPKLPSPARSKPLPRKAPKAGKKPPVKVAKPPTVRETYLLHLSLVGSEPEVWRRLILTTDTTLAQLHTLIQLLMDLNDEHLHRFKIGYDYFGSASPDNSMDDRELYDGKTLYDIYAAGYKKFFYTYDFAANRNHRLTIQQVLPYEEGMYYPLCTNGAHAAPPDNSVTTAKYNDLLEALTDKHHSDHELAREILGRDWEVDYFSASEVNEVIRQRFPVAAAR